MNAESPSLLYHLATLAESKMVTLDRKSKIYEVSMDPKLGISLMMEARAGLTGVSVTTPATTPALANVPSVLLNPLGPMAEIDSCGENVGSSSCWFNFASKFAPLAHIQITKTGSRAVSVVGDVVVRYPSVIHLRRWSSIHTVSYKDLTTSITPLLQALCHELCSRGLYAAPAGNAEWEHGARVRIGVWHYGEVAGICASLVRVELLDLGEFTKDVLRTLTRGVVFWHLYDRRHESIINSRPGKIWLSAQLFFDKQARP